VDEALRIKGDMFSQDYRGPRMDPARALEHYQWAQSNDSFTPEQKRCLRPAQTEIDIPPDLVYGRSPFGFLAYLWRNTKNLEEGSEKWSREYAVHLLTTHGYERPYVEGHQIGFCTPTITFTQAQRVAYRWRNATPGYRRVVDQGDPLAEKNRMSTAFLVGVFDGVSCYEALVSENLLAPCDEDDWYDEEDDDGL
jgi:hypothetical protein